MNGIWAIDKSHGKTGVVVHKRGLRFTQGAIYFFLGYPALLLLLQILGLKYTTSIPIFGIINTLVLLYIVIKSIKNKTVDIVLLCFVQLCLFLIGMLYPGNYKYIVQYMTNNALLLQVIPAMFIFRSTDDYGSMIRWSAEIGLFVLIVNTAYHFMGFTGLNYMAFANLSILSWCFIVYYARMSGKLIWIVASAFFGLILFCFSSRGGILYVSAYLTYTIFASHMKKKSRAVVLLFLLVSLVIIWNNYDHILQSVGAITDKYGMYNRVLDTLQRNTSLFHSDARLNLWSSASEKIWEKPLFGYGICGDCVLFGGTGWYVHNLFLELLLNYGVFIGGLFSLGYIGIGIFMLFRCHDRLEKELFFIFYIIALSQTMISYSIYLNFSIYVSIVLFLRAYKEYKHKDIDRTMKIRTK